MPRVEIYKLQNDGTQTVIATCTLDGDVVRCTGDEVFVANLERNGIRDYEKNPPGTLYPKNGRRFLEQLKNNFKSGYLNAGEIVE